MLAFMTARLDIRPLAKRDEALYCELYMDAKTMRFIDEPLPRERTVRSFRAALASMRREPSEQFFLTMVEKSTRQAVGICAIQQIDERQRSAEAGIILRPASWSQGYATECLAALITQTFARFPLDQLWAQYSVDNSIAARLFSRLGFARCDEGVPQAERGSKRVWSVLRRQQGSHSDS